MFHVLFLYKMRLNCNQVAAAVVVVAAATMAMFGGGVKTFLQHRTSVK